MHTIIDIVVIITFIGLALRFNGLLIKGSYAQRFTKKSGSHHRGSCWAITLTVIGWICFAKGTLDILQIIHLSRDVGWRDGNLAFLFSTIYHKFGAGLCFLFAAYILRSLEDALDHFKTQSVWASNYYSSLVEKDSPSVPPHEIELKDGVEDR